MGTLNLLVQAAQAEGALCLDGTPSAYYFHPGTGSGANKWLLFHEGGGWCTSLNDCYGRSNTALGSSKGYAQTMNLGGDYFSSNMEQNPLMYNWNMVYFKYCDGGSFAGNNETSVLVQGRRLYFRGFRNLEAYHKDLATNHNLLSGTDFVISGCSAGGLATYLHVDWWTDNLPQGSHVKGMPDSGFFLDYDSTAGPKYASQMRWVFEIMNATSGVNKDCITAHMATQDTYKCYFAEHTSPHIKTPIFPLQSEYDSWQTANILGSKDDAEINKYGLMFVDRFHSAVESDSKNGAFLDSCFHHCGGWNSISIDNVHSSSGFNEWFKGQNKGVFFQNKPYPCTACCT